LEQGLSGFSGSAARMPQLAHFFVEVVELDEGSA
jgi:hypothetical protein